MLLPFFIHPHLLEQALTHRSFVRDFPGDTANNERLEFLGDALLNSLCGIFLFSQFPTAKEGTLTQYRAFLVECEQLARFATELNLASSIRLGKGVSPNARILSSTFEAIVGAYFLDQSQSADRVGQFVYPFFLSVLPSLQKTAEDLDVKGTLQAWALSHYHQLPRYQTDRIGGTDNAPHFTSRVYINQQLRGTGEGERKQSAEKQAARAALQEIKLP